MSDGLHIRIAHAAPDSFALHVDTTLPPAGITALFGSSGSGKTTILDCIAGLRPDIDDADIRCSGNNWQQGAKRLPPWRREVGYVFQDTRLFTHLSVAGNLDYAERRAGSGGPSRADVVGWLQIGALLSRSTTTLSAGQAQRVAIARALLSAPRLLLLDEPLANLDRPAAAECLRCLQRVAVESGLPMVFVSHRIEEVATIADHLLLIEAGQVQAEGPLTELLSRLDSSLAEDDNAAAILTAAVVSLDREFGLTELTADSQRLFVASDAVVGESRRLRIPARDVSVCRERPGQTSILNILPVTLDSMRSISKTHCLLRLRLADQYLLARITERSRRDLNLAPGDALYAQIKSSALLDNSSPP